GVDVAGGIFEPDGRGVAAVGTDAEAADRLLAGRERTLAGHADAARGGTDAVVDGSDGRDLPGRGRPAQREGVGVARLVAAERQGAAARGGSRVDVDALRARVTATADVARPVGDGQAHL